MLLQSSNPINSSIFLFIVNQTIKSDARFVLATNLKKKKAPQLEVLFSGEDGIRTHDLLTASQTLKGAVICIKF